MHAHRGYHVGCHARNNGAASHSTQAGSALPGWQAGFDGGARDRRRVWVGHFAGHFAPTAEQLRVRAADRARAIGERGAAWNTRPARGPVGVLRRVRGRSLQRVSGEAAAGMGTTGVGGFRRGACGRENHVRRGSVDGARGPFPQVGGRWRANLRPGGRRRRRARLRKSVRREMEGRACCVYSWLA